MGHTAVPWLHVRDAGSPEETCRPVLNRAASPLHVSPGSPRDPRRAPPDRHGRRHGSRRHRSAPEPLPEGGASSTSSRRWPHRVCGRSHRGPGRASALGRGPGTETTAADPGHPVAVHAQPPEGERAHRGEDVLNGEDHAPSHRRWGQWVLGPRWHPTPFRELSPLARMVRSAGSAGCGTTCHAAAEFLPPSGGRS